MDSFLHVMDSIFNVVGEVALTLMVILTSIMMINLRQDIRELKAMLQRRLPPEVNVIESE